MHPEIYLRLDRAFEHVKEARDAIAAWVAENREHVYVRVEGSTATPSWPRTAPPERIGILVGESAYNLRAALDYLVFRLAIADSGEEQPRTQFPIESTPEGFAARRGAFLAGVSNEHVTMIEAFQPYRGNDWIVWLRELSNLDKHRAIPLTSGIHGQTQISVGGTDEHLAELGGVRQPDGAVHFPATMAVTFPDGPPVLDILEELVARVTEVCGEFAAPGPNVGKQLGGSQAW
jgi:hypothetical protein